MYRLTGQRGDDYHMGRASSLNPPQLAKAVNQNNTVSLRAYLREVAPERAKDVGFYQISV